ncbi:MAG: cytochrome c3 family protein [Actinomycetota bacterium]
MSFDMRIVSKPLFLVAAILALVLAIPSIALASGYNATETIVATNTAVYPVHGGYTSTTNKCKNCHAVHLATGTYVLTRGNSAAEACDVCHGIGGLPAAPEVVMNSYGHGLDTTETTNSITLYAPDDTTPTPYSVSQGSWGCDKCHSVHAAVTLIVKLAGFSSTKLLKADPNPGKSYYLWNPSLIDTSTRETTQNLTAWCSACHNANIGGHKDPKTVSLNGVDTTVYGHDTSVTAAALDTTTGYALDVSPDNNINSGPQCEQCHALDDPGYSYPHSSSGPSLLKGVNSGKTNLDKVCVSCHNTSSLP